MRIFNVLLLSVRVVAQMLTSGFGSRAKASPGAAAVNLRGWLLLASTGAGQLLKVEKTTPSLITRGRPGGAQGTALTQRSEGASKRAVFNCTLLGVAGTARGNPYRVERRRNEGAFDCVIGWLGGSTQLYRF